ncbi:MAG: hypothetical protein WC809_02975 [Sinimarinibacterium sp.]|jgi:alkylhydroperoxidase family enzyme
MPRIPYPTQLASERVQWLMERVPRLNLLRMESWAEGIVESILRVSDGVLNRSELDPVLRQVALLRLCAAVDSPYEFEQLAKVSRRYRMSDELIAAAREGSASAHLDPDQRMAARLAEDLAIGARPSEEVFTFFKARLPTRHFVELVIGIGFYLMQSRVIETFGIELEDQAIDLSGQNLDAGELEAWRNGRA